jgi:ATP-dependent DNA helicase RecG
MSYVYPERESKSLEFKSRIPNFHNLIKTCVAFANGMGGKIIIGVDDKSREIVGIDEKVRNK